MITEQDLQEAIAECEGQRNPNANTCIKLASFYTIQERLFGERKNTDAEIPATRAYSFSNGNVITYHSDTVFSNLIYEKPQDEVLPVMDELMTTLQVINPRLYDSVIRELEER